MSEIKCDYGTCSERAQYALVYSPAAPGKSVVPVRGCLEHLVDIAEQRLPVTPDIVTEINTGLSQPVVLRTVTSILKMRKVSV